MKLLEIEIRNVRGIQYMTLKPEGKSLVICGPNGSGKSAVVDALDFLLTGQIGRLTGEGTGGLSLAKHGPHVGHKPEDAEVRAVVKVPGLSRPVKLTRSISTPGDVRLSDESARRHVEPVLDLARLGQHVLSRRQIVNFVNAQPAYRANQVQQLLNLADIDIIRSALVAAANELQKECSNKTQTVRSKETAVSVTLKVDQYSPKVALEAANKARAILGGAPIPSLDPASLKVGLPDLPFASRSELNSATVRQDVETISEMLSSRREEVERADEGLRSLLKTIRSDAALRKASLSVDLMEMGVKLLDESGRCPLCGTEWPAGQLRQDLEKRLADAQLAREHQKKVLELANTVLKCAEQASEMLRRLANAARAVGREEDMVLLEGWIGSLARLKQALASPIEEYPLLDFGHEQVGDLLAPDGFAVVLGSLLQAVQQAYPEPSQERDAWDKLTLLEQNLKALSEAEADADCAVRALNRAEFLKACFLMARDDILGSLYNTVKDRFVALYRQLHERDEQQFTAVIKPREAALDLEVDFLGRRMFPPNALHSEGHQDSMGFCLFLALSEQVTKGVIELVVLDDVVLSIDAEHQRQVCHLLATSFPEKQFLITTHQKAWAYELCTQGVVARQHLIHFHGWRVDTGPQLDWKAHTWDKIGECLQKGNVENAAWELRRGLEHFFGLVCDALGAKVRFRTDCRWDAGELAQAAIARYRNLLKQARAAANSWGRREVVDALGNTEAAATATLSRSQAEQWPINPSVHYNDWCQLSVSEFQPVVDAYRQLHEMFVCDRCNSILHLVGQGSEPEEVRCNCGNVSWDLIERKPHD